MAYPALGGRSGWASAGGGRAVPALGNDYYQRGPSFGGPSGSVNRFRWVYNEGQAAGCPEEPINPPIGGGDWDQVNCKIFQCTRAPGVGKIQGLEGCSDYCKAMADLAVPAGGWVSGSVRRSYETGCLTKCTTCFTDGG